MALVQSLITVVVFVVMLGGLVLVHEIGPFVTARLARVRVLEFGIGFPPRAKVLANRGETLYSLNWLPIGGFVKLEGEDGDDSGDPRSFQRAPAIFDKESPGSPEVVRTLNSLGVIVWRGGRC